jgi:hypothetical protein
MSKGTITKADVLARIEDAILRAGTAQRLAEEWEVSAAYISDFRAGKREPGPKILERLGLTAETRYNSGEATA